MTRKIIFEFPKNFVAGANNSGGTIDNITNQIKTFDEIESELKYRETEKMTNPKSTGEELFQLLSRIPMKSDSRPFDYVRKTHEIYNPKSFTTEITWFRCDYKLPEKDCEVLLLTKHNKIKSEYDWIASKNIFSYEPGIEIEIEYVKYWAYLPELK